MKNKNKEISTKIEPYNIKIDNNNKVLLTSKEGIEEPYPCPKCGIKNGASLLQHHYICIPRPEKDAQTYILDLIHCSHPKCNYVLTREQLICENTLSNYTDKIIEYKKDITKLKTRASWMEFFSQRSIISLIVIIFFFITIIHIAKLRSDLSFSASILGNEIQVNQCE